MSESVGPQKVERDVSRACGADRFKKTGLNRNDEWGQAGKMLK